MGYYSRFTGRIDIDPPVPWGLIKDSPSYPGPDFDSDARLLIEEDRVDTDEGLMIKRRAIAIVPASEEPFKGYRMEENIQAVVDLTGGVMGLTTFIGHIGATGADGEQWRVKVVDRKAVRFEPAVVWPAESE